LNLKSVHPERRYWPFSGARYAETPFPEQSRISKQEFIESLGFFEKPAS
jgi:hypothetical protein